MLINGLEGIGHAYVEATTKGVQYTAKMQSATITLATAMLAVRPDAFTNISQAMPAAASALDTLRDKAIAAGVPFESLRDTYAIAYPALMESGVTGLHEQMDVVLGFSRALQSEHITGQKALRDMLAEFHGNTERTTFGKVLDDLGLTKKAMEAAKESGTEAQLIMKTLSAQTEAAGLRANSYEGRMNSLGNTLDRLKGKLADPVFEKLGPLLGSGKGALGSAQAEGVASGTGNFTVGLMEDLAHRWAQITELFDEKHFGHDAPFLQNAGEKTALGGLGSNIAAATGNAEVDAQNKLVDGLQKKIAAAKDDKSVAEARKELEDAIAAASERMAKAQGDARDRAQGLLLALQDIERHFHPGTEKEDTAGAERRKRESDEAQAAYLASPRAAAARAGQDGDAVGDAIAKDAEKAEAIAKHIQAAYPKMTAQQTLDNAKAEVAYQARTKEAEKLDKVLDSVDAKVEKQKTSTELAAAAAATFAAIMADLPEGRRGVAGTLDDHEGLTMAIRSLPNDTEEERKKREDLGKMTIELTRIQNDYNAAKDREGRDQKDAEGAKKQHDDMLAAEQLEVQIMEARAHGNEAEARQLQRKLDLQREINRLMGAGASYQEAAPIAQKRVDLNDDQKDEKKGCSGGSP